MRVRTYLRRIRASAGLSLGEVSARTGIAKGELSMFERGHSIPRHPQVIALESVYGPARRWYPATVWRALVHDLGRCVDCGEELDPGDRLNRVHHEVCPPPSRRAPDGA